MSVVRGSRSFLNYVEETAFNSGVASGSWKNLPLISETFGETVNAIVSTQIQPDRTIPDSRGGNIMANGGFTGDFCLARYLTLWKHLLGSSAGGSYATLANVAATTAYTRGVVKIGPTGNTNLYRCVVPGTTSGSPGADFVTNDGSVFASGTSQWVFVAATGSAQSGQVITGAPNLPAGGLMFERGMFADAAVQYFLATGCRVESAAITQPQDGIASIVWSLLAMGTNSSPTATISGTPASPTDEGVVGFECAAEILNGDGSIQQVTAVKSLALTVANNFETDNFRLGSRHRKDLVEKRRSITGTVDLFFEDLTYYNRFKAETIFGVRFSWYHGAEYFSIVMPEVKFFGDPNPKIGGEGSVSSQYTLSPFKKSGPYDIQVAYDIVA